MILLLNLLPLIIGIAGGFWAHKRVQKCAPGDTAARIKAVALPVFITLASLYILNSATPSYMPKGQIKRTAVPAFEVKEGTIKNDLLSPIPVQERDKVREEQYKKPLPFLKQEEKTDEL